MSTHFPKGQSPNPGGLTSEHRKMAIEFRYACTREGIKRLPLILSIIDDPETPPNTRSIMWNSLLDRGIGKPAPVQIDSSDEDGIPPSQMTQEQINKHIEGNFFGAVEDMLTTKNERFMELVNKAANESKNEINNTISKEPHTKDADDVKDKTATHPESIEKNNKRANKATKNTEQVESHPITPQQ